jgi:hypothetical protein
MLARGQIEQSEYRPDRVLMQEQSSDLHKQYPPTVNEISIGRTGIIECVVRDISEIGACLKVRILIDIPDTFNLLMASEQTPRPCRIVWRNERQMGVKFQ